MEDIYAKVIQLKKAGVNSAFCILTDTTGSVPRKAGSKMVVTHDGQIFGTVGGGHIEMKIIEKAIQVCKSGHPLKYSFNLKDDLGMHCGGSVEVFIDPLTPAHELLIFGAGHIGKSLARLARSFGFNVTLIDNRQNLLDELEQEGFRTLLSEFVKAAETIETTKNTFIVVTTPKHKYDEAVTGILAAKSFKYLGMIGSEKKVAFAIENFKKLNILSDAQIQNINMPIGIPFNAQTPEEIAISILAKLIDVKNS